METKKTVQWWNKVPSGAWNAAKTKVMAAWERLSGTEARLQKAAAEGAVVFGREARAAYADIGEWSDALETRLAADWRLAGREAENAWETVKEAVRHGWESAPAVRPRAARKTTSRSARASGAAGKGAVAASPDGALAAPSASPPRGSGRASGGSRSEGSRPRVSGVRGGIGKAGSSKAGPKPAMAPKTPEQPREKGDDKVTVSREPRAYRRSTKR
jgi:hypothetical protein